MINYFWFTEQESLSLTCGRDLLKIIVDYNYSCTGYLLQFNKHKHHAYRIDISLFENQLPGSDTGKK